MTLEDNVIAVILSIASVLGPIISGVLSYIAATKKSRTELEAAKERNRTELEKIKEIHKAEMEKLKATYEAESKSAEQQVQLELVKEAFNNPRVKQAINRELDKLFIEK